MTVSDKSLAQNLAALLDKIRAERPLVHQITNYVSVNDCANVVLAIGGAPVMADDQNEVEDMVAIASALVLNIGTLNSRTVEAMLLAGRQANRLGKPVIFDPVGVGATRLRTETARALLHEIKFAIVRGNISEISALAGNAGTTRGVDASGAEGNAALVAARLAEMTGSVVAVTGAVDTIAHTGQLIYVANGHSMLARITGTGCMATALTGAFCAVTDDYSLASAGGLVCLGLAGERAAARHQGIGSFRAGLLDEVSLLCGRDIAEHGQVHVG